MPLKKVDFMAKTSMLYIRMRDLIRREKTSELSVEEQSELDHYLQLEHLMRLAKVRARQYLTHECHLHQC